MNKSNIFEKVNLLINKLGEEKLLKKLEEISIDHENKKKSLTIVANEGIHNLPSELLRGEIYVVTRGSIDFSSPEAIIKVYEDALIKLSEKLKSNNWERIYLVPFGHATLSMQIKLLVYRISGIETIDLFHLGKGQYFDFQLKQREIIVKAFNESTDIDT